MRASSTVRNPADNGASPPPRHYRYGLVLACFGVAAAAALALGLSFVMGAPQFRVAADGSSLEIEGVTPGYEGEVKAIFEPDLGRSLAAVDIDERHRQLRLLPTVRDARVARVWPRTLSVAVEERVAIAQLSIDDGRRVRMIDRDGVILESRGQLATTLPVIIGIEEGMPMPDRRRRLDLYQEVIDVFSTRGRGKDVHEVNLSDPANAVVRAKHRGQLVDLQMGHRNLPHRLDVFLSYFDSWQSEFGPLESVDLRFERQVPVRPLAEAGGSG